MITHIWTILCSRAILDQDTNNISLIDAVEQITVRKLNAPSAVAPIRMELVTLLAKSTQSPEKGTERVSMLLPSGKVGKFLEMSIDLSQADRSRNRVFIEGLPLEESGRYTFRVEVQQEGQKEWGKVAEIPIDITFEPQTEQPKPTKQKPKRPAVTTKRKKNSSK